MGKAQGPGRGDHSGDEKENKKRGKEKMKFCKDCRYSDGFVSYMKCKRPTGEIDPVLGEPIILDVYCKYERSYQGLFSRETFFPRNCGPEGRFWKKKEEEQNDPGQND